MIIELHFMGFQIKSAEAVVRQNMVLKMAETK